MSQIPSIGPGTATTPPPEIVGAVRGAVEAIGAQGAANVLGVSRATIAAISTGMQVPEVAIDRVRTAIAKAEGGTKAR